MNQSNSGLNSSIWMKIFQNCLMESSLLTSWFKFSLWTTVLDFPIWVLRYHLMQSQAPRGDLNYWVESQIWSLILWLFKRDNSWSRNLLCGITVSNLSLNPSRNWPSVHLTLLASNAILETIIGQEDLSIYFLYLTHIIIYHIVICVSINWLVLTPLQWP